MSFRVLVAVDEAYMSLRCVELKILIDLENFIRDFGLR